MSRWQTLTALAAFTCAVLGATHLKFHSMLTLLAIVLIVIAAVPLLAKALTRSGRSPGSRP